MASGSEEAVFSENKMKHENPASHTIATYMSDMVNSRDMQEVIESQGYM